MKKVRLGLCIGDNEYRLRFTNCIMNHYQEQVELHIYSENAELKRDRKSYDIVLMDDVKKKIQKNKRKEACIGWNGIRK